MSTPEVRDITPICSACLLPLSACTAHSQPFSPNIQWLSLWALFVFISNAQPTTVFMYVSCTKAWYEPPQLIDISLCVYYPDSEHCIWAVLGYCTAANITFSCRCCPTITALSWWLGTTTKLVTGLGIRTKRSINKRPGLCTSGRFAARFFALDKRIVCWAENDLSQSRESVENSEC